MCDARIDRAGELWPPAKGNERAIFDAKCDTATIVVGVPEECIFCQIAKEEIPAKRIFETDTVLAFPDQSPQAPSHVLVIPKAHVENAYEVTPEQDNLLGEMTRAARAVADQLGIAPQGSKGGYRLVMNVGEDARNSVAHLHMHVLGGRTFDWPPG